MVGFVLNYTVIIFRSDLTPYKAVFLEMCLLLECNKYLTVLRY